MCLLIGNRVARLPSLAREMEMVFMSLILKEIALLVVEMKFMPPLLP